VPGRIPRLLLKTTPMTKKDYEFMERIFGKLAKTVSPGILNIAENEIAVFVAVNDFCEYAKRDNPRFNATKFRRAVIEHETDDNENR
jgi:hypothetical protein